jgi:hypothetical protein
MILKCAQMYQMFLSMLVHISLKKTCNKWLIRATRVNNKLIINFL